MVSQISSARVRPEPTVQTLQQKPETGTFESLIQSPVGGVSPKSDTEKKAGETGANPKEEQSTGEKKNGAKMQTELQPLATMLWQSIGNFERPVMTQNADGTASQPRGISTIPLMQEENNILRIMQDIPSAPSQQVGGVGRMARVMQNVPAATEMSGSSPLHLFHAAQNLNLAEKQQATQSQTGNIGEQPSEAQSVQTAEKPEIAQVQTGVFPVQTKPAETSRQGMTEQAPAQEAKQSTRTSADFKPMELDKLPESSYSVKERKTADDSAGQGQNAAGFSDLFQTQKVIIPVSDKPETVVAKPVSTQLAHQITSNYRAGNSKFSIDLYPQQLGKVSVKMAVQNGILTVEIAASNPKTQSMLMSNTGEIKSILQSSVDQPVQVMQSSQEKAWYQQQEQSGQSYARQQQQEQQKENRENRVHYDAKINSLATEDFLAVMQQLNPKVNAI